MKKILWALSVVLILLIATGVSADIRSDKCNTYSNDLGISPVLGTYSGDTCVWAGSIVNYTIGTGSIVLCSGPDPNSRMRVGKLGSPPFRRKLGKNK